MDEKLLLAIPFLQTNPVGYAARAFEITRQFLFKWTVNWRFVGESIFRSPSFSATLLSLHVSIVGLFACTTWLAPSHCNNWIEFLLRRGRQQQQRVDLSVPFITTTLLSCLVIGLLCARTLHYQFFAYLAWSTPFLLWQAGYGPVVTCVLWAVQEWAWNVYPSTNVSSVAVVLSLAVQVVGVGRDNVGKEHIQ